MAVGLLVSGLGNIDWRNRPNEVSYRNGRIEVRCHIFVL